MQVNVRYLDNLKLEAQFDDFTIITDQPIRYKGDGTAPGPFDYFLASSALCAAYFVKLYCVTRDIPTQDIRVTQNNIIDPENRYNQIFDIQIELPESISEKDRKGILNSMERCTVKRVIQNQPEFRINPKDVLGVESSHLLENIDDNSQTMILGKDSSLEETITKMSAVLAKLGINIEVASWRNPVPHVWSVHIRDADSPLCYTNGKGASKNAALCSALGEYIERISNNYFYNDYFLGEEIAQADFVHYPEEKWFKSEDDQIPQGLMDELLLKTYGNNGELKASHLSDICSANQERGICALPFTRQSDQKTVYIPTNLIGNIFVSNGMSAGNNQIEARVQALSEIFERAVKNQIILEQMTLPDVPSDVLKRYPQILEGIQKLEEQGFPVLVKDASLGGKYPVLCVSLMNPRNGGVFASFGAHPKFEIALERSLTELLQGRSFEGLNDLLAPTFNEYAVSEHNNIIDHFIDSTGVISWKFFSNKSDFEFVDWNHDGDTQSEYEYLMQILKGLEKEVYIAEYEHLGASACRIIIPNYSEIYPAQDIIWDNHNRALIFRDDILNIHDQSQRGLNRLLNNFEEQEIDDYMDVGELIGVTFDEGSTWGQLTVGELKCLIHLAMQNLEEAKAYVEQFMTFNDNLASRKMLYQLLNNILEVEINPHLDLLDYEMAFKKMYGDPLYHEALKMCRGELNFHGLTPTNGQLDSLEKHKRLIASYKKLHQYRSTAML